MASCLGLIGFIGFMVQGLGFRVNSKAPTLGCRASHKKRSAQHPQSLRGLSPYGPSKRTPIAPLKEPL